MPPGWRAGMVFLALAATAWAQSAAEVEEIDRLVGESLQLERAGRVRDAIAAMEKALALERRTRDPDHWDVAGSHHRLAGLHEKLKEYETARGHLLRVVEIARRQERAWRRTDARFFLADLDRRRRMTGEELRLLAEAKALNRRKMLLWRAGRYRAALPFVDRVREIALELWGPKHPEHARRLHELGLLYFKLGEAGEAEARYRETLELRREVLGGDHPLTAESLHNLGQVRLERGALPEAGPLLERARVVYAAARGRADPGFLVILRTLGRYRRQVGDLEGAERVLREAVSLGRTALGERHPEYPAVLEALAILLLERGDAHRARPLLEQALPLARASSGGKDPGGKDRRHATLLMHLGAAYGMLGLYDEAERFEDRGVALVKSAYGEAHPTYADALNNRALLDHARGRPARAIPLLREALRILAASTGETSPDYATVLHNLAVVHESLGDFREAQRCLDEARTIWRRAYGPEHPRLATALTNAATLRRDAGDYLGAVPLAEQAVAVWKRAVGERHPVYATALSNLGALYQGAGDYGRAEAVLSACVRSVPEELRGTPMYTASLNNLGAVHWETGDYARAEAVLSRALAAARRLGADHPLHAGVLANVAALRRATGDLAAAERGYRSAWAIQEKALGADHPDVARAMLLLAGTHLLGGAWERAEPMIERARRIAETAWGTAHPGYADVLHALARLRRGEGNDAAAQELLERVVRIRSAALGTDHPHSLGAKRELAVVHLARGNAAQAGTLLETVLEAGRKALGETHPEYASILESTAVLRRVQKDQSAAAALYREAIAIRRGNLDLAAAALSERRQLAMTRRLRATLDAYVAMTAGDPERGEEVYRRVLDWKGAVFARQRLLRLRRRHPGLEATFERLEQAYGHLAALALSPPAPGRQVGWRRRLEELAGRVEGIERELARAGAPLAALRAPPDPAALSATLPPGAALVDYLEFAAEEGRRLTAFVLRRGTAVHRVDLGPAAPVAAAVDGWRRAVGARDRKKAGRAPEPAEGPGRIAAELRRLVWTPLEPHLGRARLVLVSPDGALNRFPFAALPGKRAGFLVEELGVCIVPAPRLLGQPETAGRSSARGLLLVGDVDFGGTSRRPPSGLPGFRGFTRQWLPLPGTAEEVEAVARIFRATHAARPTATLTGAKATEHAFRAGARRHRHVHCATHGFFAPPRVRSALRATGESIGWHPGLLSGIVLAGANDKPGADGEDGLLTAVELASLDLDGVELLVLSACETGLGRSAGGEGLLGLLRAAQVSGVRSVVGSLWQVDDQRTRALMTRFYSDLWKAGLTRVEALRAAQLALLRTGASPKHWAAWVISGDWR